MRLVLEFPATRAVSTQLLGPDVVDLRYMQLPIVTDAGSGNKTCGLTRVVRHSTQLTVDVAAADAVLNQIGSALCHMPTVKAGRTSTHALTFVYPPDRWYFGMSNFFTHEPRIAPGDHDLIEI